MNVWYCDAAFFSRFGFFADLFGWHQSSENWREAFCLDQISICLATLTLYATSFRSLPSSTCLCKKKECVNMNLCFPNRLIKVPRITGFLAMCNIWSVLEQRDRPISHEVAAHTLTHELVFFLKETLYGWGWQNASLNTSTRYRSCRSGTRNVTE